MSSRSEKKSEKVFYRLLLINLSRAKRSLKKSFSDYSLVNFLSHNKINKNSEDSNQEK